MLQGKPFWFSILIVVKVMEELTMESEEQRKLVPMCNNLTLLQGTPPHNQLSTLIIGRCHLCLIPF